MSRKANIPVMIEQYWIDAIDRWRRQNNVSLAEMGKMAGEAVGEEPYSHATMSRLLAGKTTFQVAQAVAHMTGIPMPVDQHLPADEAHWLELGRRLKAADHRLFIDESHSIRDLVESLEQRVAKREERKTDRT